MPETGIFPQTINAVILNTINQFVICQIAPNISFHAIVAFIVPVLVNLLQLKYQGNSAFEEHPIRVLLATGCLLVYCLGCAVELAKFSGNAQRYTIFVHRLNFFSGSLSIAFFASMIFPSSMHPFLYGLCITASVDHQYLYNTIEMFIDSIYVYIRSMFLRTMFHNVRDRRSILPVYHN